MTGKFNDRDVPRKVEDMNAMITPKIVEITGNAATQAFVGKAVTKCNTANGIVYAIGNTGYVLSSAEYRMFAAAGAIASGSAQGRQKSRAQAHPQQAKRHASEPRKKIAEQPRPRKAMPSQQELDAQRRKKAKTAAAKRQKAAGQAARNIADISSYEDEAPMDAYVFTAKDAEYLETSPFLLNYPTPEFKVEEPERRGFFDRSEDAGRRLSKFFDNVGRKCKDKIIGMIDADEDTDDEPKAAKRKKRK